MHCSGLGSRMQNARQAERNRLTSLQHAGITAKQACNVACFMALACLIESARMQLKPASSSSKAAHCPRIYAKHAPGFLGCRLQKSARMPDIAQSSATVFSTGSHARGMQDTGDTRETPAIDVCKGLLTDNACLNVYDPKVCRSYAPLQHA